MPLGSPLQMDVGSGTPSIERLYLTDGKKVLQAHCEHHVTGHFEPAAHKGAGRVQFAFDDGKPIVITDGYGDIRLLDAAGDEFTCAIDDFERPYTGLFTGDVPLECLCHPGSRSS